jgi:hypothetical protein
MTFPIIVRIPQRVLATCYQNIPRPVWEARVYWLCLCSISIILLYILTVGVYEAQRLFNDVTKIIFLNKKKFIFLFVFKYLARAELRNRMPIINPTLIDLTDLTAAVQDEQKIR